MIKPPPTARLAAPALGLLAASAVWLNASVAAPKAPALDAAHAKNMAASLELFTAKVRPILLQHCANCHGKGKLRAGFDLTTRAGLLKGADRGVVVKVGDPGSSRLVKLIKHAEQPPMPHKAPKLSQDQIDVIAKWIELGAAYDKPLVDPSQKVAADGPMKITDDDRRFWSFQPLRQTAPAQVKNKSWPRGPADQFVLAKLEAKGLSPNAMADRRALIRRAYFGLIGLPPTPEEIDAFVKDPAPDAYPKLIDKLMASPRYGERWARHWLDVARFAESHGFEQDYNRPHAYHYRDFVIKALNADMPYDQFVRWQLAGDEFAPDDSLAMMATGFLGAGVFPTQLTEKEFEIARYDELDDMANTTGTAFLGLTIGCARCHDHKFDPIPAHDYYRLLSTFSTTIRSEIELDLSDPSARGALREWEKQRAPLTAALGAFEKNELPGRLDAWIKQRVLDGPGDAQPTWAVLAMSETNSTGGATFQKQGDGSYLLTGKNPRNDKWRLVAKTTAKGVTAVRVEALAHPSMKRGGPGRASNGNFALSVLRVSAGPADGSAKPKPVKLVSAKATFQQNKTSLSVASVIDADRVSGWAVDPQFGKDHAAVFEFDRPVDYPGGTTLVFEFEFNNNVHHSIGRPRLSVTTAPPPVALKGNAQPQDVTKVLTLIDRGDAGKLSAKQRATLLAWYKPRDEKWRTLNQRVQQHLAAKPKAKLTKVMVTSEGLKPMKHHADGRGFPHFYKETHFLKRGDPNQKQGVATQGFLQVLMRDDQDTSRWRQSPPEGTRTSYRRRSLANWMTDTEHGAGHLLARVIVNRLWQHHLGRGIVATPNDFGFQGERPTHPQLLDWLATELIRNDWRLKPMHKLIMTSATYMQGTTLDESDASIDPDNMWLWRRPPRRLEAEVIRDAMLSLSGQLDLRMYGPGTLDEGHKRRSIYFMIKRSKLVPMMQLFDSPEPLVSQGDRPATTIAPQALMFMNNPHVRSYALAFAARLDQSPDEAVRQGYVMALGREPTKAELTDNADFLREQTAAYTAEKKSDARLLALADFCQVLFSLNEFVYVD